MKKPDWTKAPHDAQFYSYGKFRKIEVRTEFSWDGNEWVKDVFDYLDWHKEGPGFEMRPESSAWNGQGLPPVGTVCEYGPYWHKCEIITEHEGFLVVWDAHDLEYFRTKNPSIFRPIKSDRERWIEAVMDIYHANTSVSVPDAMGDIYDAGLAKLP